MEDLVSVVIPMFNGQDTILRCLDSLRFQTYKNLEVLIIDDGSMDCSAELVDNYIRQHNLYGWHLSSVSNGGVAKARNLGISMATGDYLCFVDSDDYVENGYVEKMLSAIQDSNSDFCITGYKKVYCKKGELDSEEDCVLPDRLFPTIYSLNSCEKLFVDGFIHPCWGKLYKTKLLRDNHIEFPNQTLSEDTVFNLEYLHYIRSIRTIQDASYYYMIDLDRVSLSKSFPGNIFDLYIRIHRDYAVFFKDNDLDKNVIERMMYAQYYSAVYKTLFNQELTYKKKKRVLNCALSSQEVRNTFLRKQPNKTLALVNNLVLHRAYKIAKIVLQVAAMKENVKL